MSEPSAIQIICPKCQGSMRNYERNSITIDQCVECRSVFLDRGELDRLIDAESANTTATADTSERSTDRGRSHGSDRSGHEGDRPSEGTRRKKRGGFLGELFGS